MFLTELQETCFLIRKKLLCLEMQIPLFGITEKNHYFSIILEKTCMWDRHYGWIVKEEIGEVESCTQMQNWTVAQK